MKNLKCFITSIFFISIIISNLVFSQGIKTVTGNITNLSHENIGSNYLYKFTLVDDITSEKINFSFFSGQFNINNKDLLYDKKATIHYLRGKAPLAIGVNIVDGKKTQINYFKNIELAIKNYEQLHFIGLYKGGQVIKGYKDGVEYENIKFTVEGANGRIIDFPIPDNADRVKFDETEGEENSYYYNKEIIVTYVLVDEYIITDLDLLLEPYSMEVNEEGKPEFFSFKGIVKEFSDSGRGPYYNIHVENPQTKETFNALAFYDGQYSNIFGKPVEVVYYYKTENYLQNINAYSEELEKSDAKNTLRVVGKFVSCEVGDFDGYLDINISDGKSMSFLTGYYCPDNINEGDKVIVDYLIEKEIEVQKINILSK